MLSMSRSEMPATLPNPKPRPGDRLSMPSVSCTKRLLLFAPKPLTFTDLKLRLWVSRSTPFRFCRASKGVAAGELANCRAPSFSTVTDAFLMSSGTRLAETTTSSVRMAFSIKLTFSTWLALVTAISWREKPTNDTTTVKGGNWLVSNVKFPSRFVVAPTFPFLIIRLTPGIG